MNKKIVTDCDGVLLDWCYTFDIWMAEQGYVLDRSILSFDQAKRYNITLKESISLVIHFNELFTVGTLPAFRDSTYWVKRLASEGWRFDVVSSLHIDKQAQRLREQNLKHIFGDVFDVIYAGIHFTNGKHDYLYENYRDTGFWWIEDSTKHAIAGRDIGLKSVIIDNTYNKDWDGLRVNDWEELYGVINDTTY